MPKKDKFNLSADKPDIDLSGIDFPTVAELVHTQQTISAPEKEERSEKFYTKVMWKGVKLVFRCATCHQFLSTEDDMILHVLIHSPVETREDLLTSLVSEKEK